MKPQDMQYMEELITSIKLNGPKASHRSDLDSLTRALKRAFDLDVSLRIFENKTNEFVGMTIYPSKTTVDVLVTTLLKQTSRLDEVQQVWARNNTWVIEMDSLLLFDPFLNANPKEIMAVLMHEIGHVVYSNTIPQRLHKVFRYNTMRLGFDLKRLVQWKRAQKIFNFVILQACESKNFSVIRTNTEVEADRFVVKTGYGEALNSFIGKLLKLNGNRLVDRSERDMEKDIRTMMTWSLENVAELEFRKTKLRAMLRTQMIQNPSKYCREVVAEIKDAFFGGSELDDNPIKENSFSVASMRHMQDWEAGKQRVLQEGLKTLFDKLGRMRKISQSEIDLISVELGKIRTADDKIYVLDLIYDKLDQVNTGLELIDSKKAERVPMSKDMLKRYRGQLEELRKQVLATRIADEQYGLFIRYPKGYEG